jgi:G3E family GTPase
MTQKIPVTVLTGFLGSGKTTLLNRILAESHGQRIAVIENEFGTIGVDQDLVVTADEEIFEMNNGCICCTVRGELVPILGQLSEHRERFDRIVLETTGLANPGPVAQTFFIEESVREHFALDAIVTLVDSAHVGLHLDDSEEAREQIAFADVIVLNKLDLVDTGTLAAVERRVRAMNAMARLVRSAHAAVSMETILGVGGFDLARALDYEPTFLEPGYPFEWLDAGHSHDDEVSSFSIETDEPVDAQRFREWLRSELSISGSDIYRMKGFLNFKGSEQRIVIQGVHMLADTASLGSWGARPRRTQLVFIGRNLDEHAMRTGFRMCLT